MATLMFVALIAGSAVAFERLVLQGELGTTGHFRGTHSNAVNPAFAGPSTCDSPHTYPGTFGDTAQYRYETWRFTNESTPFCLSATLSVPTGAGQESLFMVAYSPSFNPSDVSQNYLADVGGPVAPGASVSMSFTFPANSTVDVEVEEWTPGAAALTDYTLELEMIGDASDCPGFESDPRNQIAGTPASETLTGTAGADIICGLGGNDRLEGGAGDDVLLTP